MTGDEQAERGRLDEHAADDQRFATGVVGEPAGCELASAPDERVDGGDNGDLAHAGAMGGEVERRQAPGERVVEVVDQAGLAAGAEDRVVHARIHEGAAKTRVRGHGISVCLLLEGDLRGGIAHCKHADQQPDDDDQRRADPDDRAGRVTDREGAGDKGGGGDAEVAGRLVESERKTAPARAGQIDLHHHRHRPGEPLVDAEQEVGGDDEPPGRGETDQQRHRQRHEPADHEQPFASQPLGQLAGGEVRERLGGAEGNDEGENRRGRAQPEVLLAHERQHTSLEADHGADERVQPDEQAELAGVRAQPEPHRRRHAGAPTLPDRLAPTIRSCSAGRGGMSATSASAKASGSASASSGLWARSNPIDENGLPERPRPQTEPA